MVICSVMVIYCAMIICSVIVITRRHRVRRRLVIRMRGCPRVTGHSVSHQQLADKRQQNHCEQPPRITHLNLNSITEPIRPGRLRPVPVPL